MGTEPTSTQEPPELCVPFSDIPGEDAYGEHLDASQQILSEAVEKDFSGNGTFETGEEVTKNEQSRASQSMLPQVVESEETKADEAVPLKNERAEPREQAADNEFPQSNRPKVALETLRTLYETVTLAVNTTDMEIDMSDTETVERQTISHFSLGQYGSALELYRNSLDAAGLPGSPILLEVAIASSLKAGHDRSEAESIMSAARDAGMNVTCAMGPLLIDRIAHMSFDRQSAADLRSTTIEYYRMNEQSGLHVKHHLGTTAAHALIQAGFAEHGVNLLSSILRSSWCVDEPLDISAMSVWLLGYAALGHKKGIQWVIEEVLDKDLALDQGFLNTLKRARRPAHRRRDGSLGYGRQNEELQAQLMGWYRVCVQKRQVQQQKAKVFGRQLVKLLAKTANRQTDQDAAVSVDD